MVSAYSIHKPEWSSLVMVAWACKGGKGRWRFLSDRGFKTSVMIGVTAGAWLALSACPAKKRSLVVSSRDVCLGLLLAGCQLRSHNRTVNR